MKDPQRVPRVTAGAGHHKEGAVDRELELKVELDAGNDVEYKVEAIKDSAVYAKESNTG